MKMMDHSVWSETLMQIKLTQRNPETHDFHHDKPHLLALTPWIFFFSVNYSAGIEFFSMLSSALNLSAWNEIWILFCDVYEENLLLENEN
jgi:hypothetical protein